MARIAKCDSNSICVGNDVFEFADGKRQVTESEERQLQNAMDNGATFTVTFEDTKKGAK